MYPASFRTEKMVERYGQKPVRGVVGGTFQKKLLGEKKVCRLGGGS